MSESSEISKFCKFCIFTAHGVGNILPNFRKPMKIAGA